MENNTYLSHHGVKGMKWGVRRTAAQLGHLTANAGRKVGRKIGGAASSANNRFKSGMADRREVKRIQKLNNKSVKKMTNEELRDYMERMALEKHYLDMKRTVNSLDQKKLEGGKAFVSDFMKNAVASAAISAGKSVLQDKFTKMGKDFLGLNEKDEYDKLKRENEMMNWKANIKAKQGWMDGENKMNGDRFNDNDDGGNNNSNNSGNKNKNKTKNNGGDTDQKNVKTDNDSIVDPKDIWKALGKDPSTKTNDQVTKTDKKVEDAIKKAGLNYAKNRSEGGKLINEYVTKSVDRGRVGNDTKVADYAKSQNGVNQWVKKQASMLDADANTWSSATEINSGKSFISNLSDMPISSWNIDDD